MLDSVVDVIDFSKVLNCEIILSLYRCQNSSNIVLFTREFNIFLLNGCCAAIVVSF